MTKDTFTKIVDGIAEYTLKGVEEAIFSWSSIVFAFLSIASFFSIFLFGFFRKIIKGLLPVLDTSIAASISMQFTLFLAACGMIIRVAPYFYAALLLFFNSVLDEEDAKRSRFLSFGVAYLLAAPALLFAAFAAFLDAKEATGMLPTAIVLTLFMGGGLYVSERRRSSKTSVSDVINGVKYSLETRSFFMNYKTFPALVAVCSLVFSFLLGGAKFNALSHQSGVFIVSLKHCLRLPLLGATANGVLLIDGVYSTSVFGDKHKIVFLPFSSISAIVYSDRNSQSCEDVIGEVNAPV